jgi:hypothetical protein
MAAHGWPWASPSGRDHRPGVHRRRTCEHPRTSPGGPGSGCEWAGGEAITAAGGLRAAVGGCAACPVSACVQAPSRAHAASAGSAGNTGRHIRGMHPRTGRMSGTWQSCQDYPLTTHVHLPGAQPGSDHRRIRRGQPPVAASGPARPARGPGRTLPAPPRRRPPSPPGGGPRPQRPATLRTTPWKPQNEIPTISRSSSDQQA